MKERKKRVRIWLIATTAFMIPLILIAVGICGLFIFVEHYNERILPNISVAGVDLSWHTHEEAISAIDPQLYEARGSCAEVTVTFPNGAQLNITGAEANLCSDAQLMIDSAYTNGRGGGYIDDTAEFIRHLDVTRNNEFFSPLAAGDMNYEISYALDTEYLRSRVSGFIRSYNDELEGSGPQIYYDRIVMVKGAGHVYASEAEVYNLVYNGLFESLACGNPVEIIYSLPESTGDAAELLAIRQSLLVHPLCAEYDPETNTISASVVGVDIDLEAAIILLSSVESGTTISIGVEYTEPEVTQEYLENLLFRNCIGECVTQIPGTENRLNNITIATASINGLILEPGEEFSFNRIVGQRTPERGYRLAPAFSSGTTVQAIGGGICQVSSTLYSAIMDSCLRVTERYPHGLPVSYIPRGRDATVSWGSLDFKFLNNTDYPLRIDAEVVGRTLTIRVYGTIIEGDSI